MDLRDASASKNSIVLVVIRERISLTFFNLLQTLESAMKVNDLDKSRQLHSGYYCCWVGGSGGFHKTSFHSRCDSVLGT